MPRPRKSFDTAGVKSATRVLALLELFDRLERPASVTEIAREMGIPQSSTSMLVNSLIDRGYLTALPDRRVQPTPRVSMLGRWVDERITDGRVTRLMRDLGEETGETILLGIASDIHVLYIAVIPATRAMRLHIPAGTRRPIADSGMGLMLLSAMDDTEIARRIARAAQAREPDAAPLAADDIMAEIAAIRATGHALSASRIVPGAGIVCTLLPTADRSQPMAIGIGGQAFEVVEKEDAFAALLKTRIARYFRQDAAT
ncbi:IclR family transcriptional regulator [Phreatobacter sp. HK31-P]